MSRMPLSGVDDENEAPSFPAVHNTYVMNRNFPNIPQPNSNPRLMFAPQPTSPFYQHFSYPPPQPPQPRFPATNNCSHYQHSKCNGLNEMQIPHVFIDPFKNKI